MHIGLHGNQAKNTGQCRSISDPRGKPSHCDSTHLRASEQTNWEVMIFHCYDLGSHKIFLHGYTIITATTRRVWGWGRSNLRAAALKFVQIITESNRVLRSLNDVKLQYSVHSNHGPDTVRNPFDSRCLYSSPTSQRTNAQTIRTDNWLMPYKGMISAVHCEDHTIQIGCKIAVY
jgi:hypothetical protein